LIPASWFDILQAHDVDLMAMWTGAIEGDMQDHACGDVQ
jgi:hypothetical protein